MLPRELEEARRIIDTRKSDGILIASRFMARARVSVCNAGDTDSGLIKIGQHHLATEQKRCSNGGIEIGIILNLILAPRKNKFHVNSQFFPRISRGIIFVCRRRNLKSSRLYLPYSA